MFSAFRSLVHFNRISRQAKRVKSRRATSRRPTVEQLEHRIAFVVDATNTFPLTIPVGSGFDGVVQVQGVNGNCTGTLLSTGRHILTAAHCVDNDVNSDGVPGFDRGNGAVDAGTHRVQFDLDTPMLFNVPAANITVHNQWNGFINQGSDIAIIDLGQLAPFPAEKRSIYRDNREVEQGQSFRFLGYGGTNRTNRTLNGDCPGGVGTVCNGNFGSTGDPPPYVQPPGSFGTKRIGFNNIDSTPRMPAGSTNPFDDYLRFDLDNPNVPGSGAIGFEAMSAPGDSGGPLLISNLIAGVSSSAVQPSRYSGTANYTRVSSFADWVDRTVEGRYDLVLDMNNQISRNDGRPDTISFFTGTIPIFGERLFISVNGQAVYDDFYSAVRSITVRGSGDDEVIAVPSDLGISMSVDGRIGNDVLRFENVASDSIVRMRAASFILQGVRGSSGSFQNVERISVHGDSRDTVQVAATTIGTQVTINGAGTVLVGSDGNLREIAEVVSVFGNGTTKLTISDDKNTRGETYIVRDNLFVLSNAPFDNMIQYADVGSLTINTSAGNDRVVVESTLDPVAINGQDGFDTVNVGLAGSVRAIGGSLTVTNSKGLTAVSVDNTADPASRTGILYRDPATTLTVLSGLTPGGDILMRDRDLSVLGVFLGDGGNVFRIHDTPKSGKLGGSTTTIRTGNGSDNITVNGTTGTLDLDVQGGLNDVTVGSTTTGVDRVKGEVTITGPGGGNLNRVLITDAPSVSGQTLTHTIGATSYSRSGTAQVNMVDVHHLFLQTGAATDTINIQGNPTNGFAPVDVASGDGNDIFNVGNAQDRLAGIGSVNLDGQNHSDIVNIVDDGNAALATYHFDVLFGVNRLSTPDATIAYSVEDARLNGGSAGNDVYVNGVAATTSLRLYLGAGDDRIDVGTSANVLSALRTLDVFGRGGDDQLVLRDHGQSVARSYSFDLSGSQSTVSLLARDVGGSTNVAFARFDRVESVTLHAGSESDTIRIAANVSGTTLAVHAGAGNDSIVVASIEEFDSEGSIIQPANSLDRIRGPLVLDGQDGVDSVLFNDQNTNHGQTYDITPSSLERTQSALMSHANVESVTINGSAGNDLFKVASGTNGPVQTLNGGGGVNTLDYSDWSGNGPGQPGSAPPRSIWYKAEGNFVDSAGGIDGTPHNDVTFAAGRVGQAFSFDGVDDYIDLGNAASLNMPASMSVDAWVNYETLTQYKYFFADFNDGGTITQGSLGIEDGRFFWAQNSEGEPSQLLYAETIAVPGEWYHVAVVRDDAAKTIKLYLNGVLDANGTYAGNVVSLQGNKLLGTSSTQPQFAGDFFHGRLDQVSIFDRAVSADQIAALYAEGGGVTPPPYSTGVIVNLVLGTATGLSGGISRIHNVTGSDGDDILVGNGGNMLQGGRGRDLLIAGALASTLNGGDDEDVLIAGTTSWDRDADALAAMLAEWTRTDLDYEARVQSLRGSYLSADRVLANGGGNRLDGDGGRDLFFAALDTDELDANPDEEIVGI